MPKTSNAEGDSPSNFLNSGTTFAPQLRCPSQSHERLPRRIIPQTCEIPLFINRAKSGIRCLLVLQRLAVVVVVVAMVLMVPVALVIMPSVLVAVIVRMTPVRASVRRVIPAPGNPS